MAATLLQLTAFRQVATPKNKKIHFERPWSHIQDIYDSWTESMSENVVFVLKEIADLGLHIFLTYL